MGKVSLRARRVVHGPGSHRLYRLVCHILNMVDLLLALTWKQLLQIPIASDPYLAADLPQPGFPPHVVDRGTDTHRHPPHHFLQIPTHAGHRRPLPFPRYSRTAVDLPQGHDRACGMGSRSIRRWFLWFRGRGCAELHHGTMEGTAQGQFEDAWDDRVPDDLD